MTEKLLNIAEDNISTRLASIIKSTHPWLTERGEETLRRKHEARGTERETEAAPECSAILLDEHYDFVRKMKLDLIEAKPASNKLGQK